MACAAVAQTAEDAFVQHLRASAEEAANGAISAAEADARAAIALDPNQAEGWYELGSVLGQAADFQGAEAAFRHAIQLQPGLAKAHFSLALTLVGDPAEKDDWSGAIAECRQALKYEPDYPQALNLLGAGLTNSGRAEEAIQPLSRALQLAPALPEAHFNLGLALESQGRLPEAEKEYRAAIAAKGSYPEAATALGKLLLRIGKKEEAAQALETALRADPDLANAHYTLARVFAALGRGSEAAIEFAEAKELTGRKADRTQSAVFSNQGLELASKDDLPGAAALLRKAIALTPDYGVPHYNLGLVLADSGDIPGAVQELAKAISLLPGQYKVWFEYGRVLRRANDPDGAIRTLAWAARLAPSTPEINSELASLRAVKPDQASAQPSVLAPRQPDVGAADDTASGHFAFAAKLSAKGDFQGAAGEFLRSLSLDPAMLDARRGLAAAYVSLKENDRAMLEYHKILLTAPEDADAHLALGKLLIAQGEKVDGLGHLRLAVKYSPASGPAQAALQAAERASAAH